MFLFSEKYVQNITLFKYIIEFFRDYKNLQKMYQKTFKTISFFPAILLFSSVGSLLPRILNRCLYVQRLRSLIKTFSQNLGIYEPIFGIVIFEMYIKYVRFYVLYRYQYVPFHFHVLYSIRCGVYMRKFKNLSLKRNQDVRV